MSITPENRVVNPDIYLGNFPPKTPGYEYVRDLATLAINVVGNLVKLDPHLLLPKAQNGEEYVSPYQVQLMRVSQAEGYPLRSAVAREFKDEVNLLFLHDESSVAARRVKINRTFEEHRARWGRGRLRKETYTGVSFYEYLDDEAASPKFGIDYVKKEAIILSRKPEGGEHAVVLVPDSQDESPDLGEIGNRMPGVIEGMARTLVVAETVADNRLTDDFTGEFKLLESHLQGWTKHKDPHTKFATPWNHVVDRAMMTVFARAGQPTN